MDRNDEGRYPVVVQKKAAITRGPQLSIEPIAPGERRMTALKAINCKHATKTVSRKLAHGLPATQTISIVTCRITSLNNESLNSIAMKNE
jgi:hypothetical protein